MIVMVFTFGLGVARANDKPPTVDVHLHFNWDQEELVSAEEVVAALEAHNVVRAIAFSTPSDNVLKLRAAGGDRIVPFFSPYITGLSRSNWFRDPKVLEQARRGLAAGKYHGIGELHLISGLGARRDTPIFLGLVALAKEFDVPMLIHTEASDYRYLLPICKQNPTLRILWAHAGGLLGPEHSRGLLRECSNVWIELSARGPQHYGGLVDAQGKLRAGWAEVFGEFPERFMMGTDPVWHAYQANRWYEADEGWQHYDEFYAFHQGWLAQLPAALAERIRYKNAAAFLAYIDTRSGSARR
jgi:predicted TIM-barrel fold metal-dependent hydrolase